MTPTLPIQFDRKYALERLVSAEAAYDLKLISKGWTVSGTLQPDNFGFVATKGDEILISFRGTQHEREWLEDFDGLSVPNLYGQGHVHQGFQIQYTAIRKSLLALLRWTMPQSVSITGHSLGAALAVLAAADLTQQSKIPRIRVYTFAGPRVGTPGFSNWFDGLVPDCYRICNLWDIVTHLPSQILGYSHVGHGVLIDGGFSTDLHVTHRLRASYTSGLENLLDLPITVKKVA